MCNYFAWKFAKDKSKYTISKLQEYFTPIILPYTNVNHTCPYRENISLVDALLHEYIIPSIVPTGQYRVDFEVIEYETIVFQGQLFVSVISQGEPVKQLTRFNVSNAVFEIN